MSYIALYREWRPLIFEDVVEQEHVVKTLKHSVSTGRIAHAYLFCGTRGTGKTTMAHILSRAINCLNPQDGNPCNECEICKGILSGSILDVLEIDAASNNSVDNIRDIRDEVAYSPTQAKYKVYIIDEVHMLSSGAFNALLKTLEEPPAHVVFILATTEPHKIPATILSRCQRFDFRRISVKSIMKRLETIASANNIFIEHEALKLMAKMSDGALRDAISLLDQCIATGNEKISYEDVLSVVGIVNEAFMAEIVDAVKHKNVEKILELVDTLIMDGKDIVQFVSDLVVYYRNLLLCKIVKNPEDVIDTYKSSLELMKSQAEGFLSDELIYTIKELSALIQSMKWASNPRILLEVSLIKLCDSGTSIPGDDIKARLSLLEKKLDSINNGIVGAVPGNMLPGSGKSAKPGTRNTNINMDADSSSRSSENEDPGNENQDNNSGSSASGKPNCAESSGHTDGQSSRKYFDSWDSVLDELKSCGRIVLYTNLLDTKAVELDDKRICIVFGEGKGFNKMLCSKAENIEIIEKAVAKVLGREVRVKCIDDNAFAENRDEEKATQKDELVEKARDIAQKLNVPFNIIDE
ncbi:MAG TPA: DNA polymerase III subunit gamma/tau [Clostridiaceae bacterium]|nr:DNA polymerase III subunit gamma/tau [Clostridiaceae bacterium]